MSVAEITLPPDNLPAIVGLPDANEWAMLHDMAQVLAKSGVVPKALRGKPDDVVVILLQARELRLPTTMALYRIHVIDGKPSMAAELMTALIRRSGHHFKQKEVTAEKAVAEYRRKEWPAEMLGEFEFTMEDAKTAELNEMWFERWVRSPGDDRDHKEEWFLPRDLGVAHPRDLSESALRAGGAPEWVIKKGPSQVKYKDSWWHYPKAMLWARCVSQIARMEFSDVLMGVTLTPEELGVEIDPFTGEMVSAPADDAVKEALLARATSLPPQSQAQLREWFREVQAPAIKNLPKKWVDAVDERIAFFEQWIVDGKDVTSMNAGSSPSDEGEKREAPQVIDTSSRPAAESDQPPDQTDVSDDQTDLAGDTPDSPGDEPADPPTGEDTPEPGEGDTAPVADDDAGPGEDQPSGLLAEMLEMDRAQLIALGKSRLAFGIQQFETAVPQRASLEKLADLFLSLKPM